ncbi:MAG: PssE/Cps14G family polysaccharide biosynthesis glycosyltransferase [Candidatus Diapherotrites archaeon]|nr:PssE/Cps14G family polysaccharide biosynthesis glycosyltransferase [Candidatus Diapherotrites archaeon]
MAKIFVTVGTHPMSFHRLTNEIDSLISDRKTKDTFFAQIGSTNQKPKFPSKELISEKEYNKKFSWADIVISHGGAGSIIHTLAAGKKLIIVPRLKKFKEHINDHQIDLAKLLEKQGKCLAVYDIKNLGSTIQRAKKFKYNSQKEKNQIGNRIEEFISANF